MGREIILSYVFALVLISILRVELYKFVSIEKLYALGGRCAYVTGY